MGGRGGGGTEEVVAADFILVHDGELKLFVALLGGENNLLGPIWIKALFYDLRRVPAMWKHGKGSEENSKKRDAVNGLCVCGWGVGRRVWGVGCGVWRT